MLESPAGPESANTPERLAHERASAKAVHPTGSFVAFAPADLLAGPAEIVRRQAARTPDRVAIGGTTFMTYAELDALSDEIAAAVLGHASPGHDRLAITIGNEASMIAAVLGALKAGVTLVPIDPTGTPVDRAIYVFEDAGCVLILATKATQDFARRVAPEAPVVIVPVDPPTNPPPHQGREADPEGTAWIIYTSGSTGSPKGVAQSYGNVAHFIDIESAAYRICPEDRVANAFSSSVNFWFRETLSALAKGASVYPIDLPNEGFSGLARAFDEHGITIVTLVPSLFRQFAPTLCEPPASLRVVKVGGEPAIRTDLELFKRRFPRGCILINRFGTTETAPVRYHFLDHDSEVMNAHIPIGYPVDGSEIVLIDEEGAEVPTDTPGELVVRSAYLATSYWNRPDLTAETFRDDLEDAKRRRYFTGDVGLARSDGCIVHLGRKDNQVQVRGFRVELAEIEIRLREVDGVADAAVAAFDDPALGTYLAGYVVPSGQPPDEKELRSTLARSLPAYMIPSQWLHLEELPRAPNGKLHRRSLPRPLTGVKPVLSGEPSTPMERLVAGHWRKVLKPGTPITVHDTFLDLGGESLGALQAIAGIEADIGVFVSPLDMGRQTLAQIARYCETRRLREDGPPRRNRTRLGAWLDRLLGRSPK